MMENQIDERIEHFEEIVYDNRFKNFRKNITTIIAFLIGVPDENFRYEDKFDFNEFEKLKTNDDAIIIRYLSRLRTQFLNYYVNIDNAHRNQMRPIETLTEYLDIDIIKYLRKKDIETNIPNTKSSAVNIAYINQYILDYIDKIKSLFPDWVEFHYIRTLFLMPGGYAGNNGSNIKNDYNKICKVILNARKTYSSQKKAYPYQMYLNWPKKFRETDGNILFNDLKFLRMLYAVNDDRFQASEYVVDAKEETKQEIYDFLDKAINVAIFVDCENVDPYSFGATILNLDDNELSKIKKIILYDDVNASLAWDYITNIVNIPVIKKDVERLLDSKSLVDITMTAGIFEEYYKNNMESIILASSDSDFWGVIKQLPSTRFFVLNEFRKTSPTIIEQLDKYKIQHCFMSYFAQDKIQQFKSDVLYLSLVERIKHFNKTGEFGTLNVVELIQELFYSANIVGAESQIEKEKETFYNKYLKNGFIIKPVSLEGKLVFKIELYKK